MLIFLMLSSLANFLMLIIYRGGHHGNVTWTLMFFTLGAVGIARVAIEQDRMYSLGYAGVLGIAAFVVMQRFIASPIFLAGILVLIGYLADRIVRDCTLIDDDVDASGQGLIDSGRLMVQTVASPPASPSDEGPLVSKPHRKTHQPGRTVMYLAAAALPLFGIGQFFLRGDATTWSQALRYLGFYLFASLSLLVTTSFLGLRRYLRQRRSEMPADVTIAWLLGGLALIAIILFIAFLAPLPGQALASFELPEFLSSTSDTTASKYGWGNDAADQGKSGDPTTSGDPNASQKEVQQVTPAAGAPAGAAADGKRDDGPAGNQAGNKQSQKKSDAKGEIAAEKQQSEKQQSGSQQPADSDTSKSKQDELQKSGPKPSTPPPSSDQQHEPMKEQRDQTQNDFESPKETESPSPESQKSPSPESPSPESPSPESPSPESQSPESPERPPQDSQRDTSADEKSDEKSKEQESRQSDEDLPSQPHNESDPELTDPTDETSSMKESDRPEAEETKPTPSDSAPPAPESDPSNSDSHFRQDQQQPGSQQQPAPENQDSMFDGLGDWLPEMTVLVKTALFLVLMGIVGYYLYLNRHLISGWLDRSRGDSTEETKEEFFDSDSQVPPRSFSSFRNPIGQEADSRRIIVITFAALEAWCREQGISRSKEETPSEFLNRVTRINPSLATPAPRVVDAYNRIVYGRGNAGPHDVAAAQAVWAAMA